MSSLPRHLAKVPANCAIVSKRTADGGVVIELHDPRTRRFVGAGRLTADQRRSVGRAFSDDEQFPVDPEAS